MDEIWKPVRGFEELYLVSNLGNVKSIRSGKILKPRKLPHGYARVNLPATSRTKRDVYIHRLVADAFCEHPKGCDVVNHIDNDPTNNKASNLEWVTQMGNVYYGMEQKRYHLNARSVIGIKDEKKLFFHSAHQAARHTGCDHSTIIKCCRGKMKTTHGYIWQYAEVI